MLRAVYDDLSGGRPHRGRRGRRDRRVGRQRRQHGLLSGAARARPAAARRQRHQHDGAGVLRPRRHARLAPGTGGPARPGAAAERGHRGGRRRRRDDPAGGAARRLRLRGPGADRELLGRAHPAAEAARPGPATRRRAVPVAARRDVLRGGLRRLLRRRGRRADAGDPRGDPDRVAHPRQRDQERRRGRGEPGGGGDLRLLRARRLGVRAAAGARLRRRQLHRAAPGPPSSGPACCGSSSRWRA